MKALVVISACICAVVGRPQFPYAVSGYPAINPYAAVAPAVGPTTYEYNVIPDIAPVPAPLPAPVIAPAVAPTEYKNQYHSQDELGQYAFGHASAGQAHSAVRDFTGAVRGSYVYINADNEEVIVNYVADQGGFRVSSNALPVAPTFEGEAPVAPEFKLEAPVFDLEAPVFDLEQVADTPEVEAAKAEHFRLVEEQKAAVAAALAAAEKPEETTEEVAEAADEEPTAEMVPEEVTEEEAVTEASEAATEAQEEVAAAEAARRRKRQVVIHPEFYRALPVKPVVLKAAPPTPLATAGVHDAELLRVVHNPGHAVAYRVYP
ncbi:hypothetical protein SK128_026517 [Halocaridina rubra]|uniref:Uncharacterized protein n=1 Tax=Halocaridina rubra TaxID=373956 RepID=A0AAN8WQ11_HALRR